MDRTGPDEDLTLLRRLLHPIVPAHYRHPVQLARRIVTSGQPAAWFAVGSAALTAAAAPLDVLLRRTEERRRRHHPVPRHPVVLVCGPPRSGTTVMAQTLIRTLKLSYVTNLMAMFPRSPVTASELLGTRPDAGIVDVTNYYGRTSGFARPNDALPIWDRWLGNDRTTIPVALDEAVVTDMASFFGSLEAAYGRPVLSKNNGLNACAHLIADALPTAQFVCMDRDPVFLAQSLLRARREIHGTDDSPYGLHGGRRDADPVTDVVTQVRWHHDLAARQEAAIGTARFHRVSYEAFCANPAATVRELADRVFGSRAVHDGPMPQLKASTSVTIDRVEFRALERQVREAIG